MKKENFDFLAVDVKTSNPELSSICQIGISYFVDGLCVDSENILINPKSDFDENCSIHHNVTAEIVKNKPTFKDLYSYLSDLFNNNIVIYYTSFDKGSFKQTCEKNNLDVFDFSKWIDGSKVAKRTWDEFKYSKFGLVNVANHIGINIDTKISTERSKAIGDVLCRAISIKGISIQEWFIESTKPMTKRTSQSDKDYKKDIEREGNPNGDMFGEVLVFTGKFFKPKKELSEIAADMGCDVSNKNPLHKDTTILVIGRHNPKSLAKGSIKSSKQIAAEKRIDEGIPIRIIYESDFIDMFV